MNPSNGKLCFVVVKSRIPGKRFIRMALFAIRMKTRFAVINRNRIIKIFLVTRNAVRRRSGELQGRMTLPAVCQAMLSVQNERRTGMIKFHRADQNVPSVGGVTIGAFQFQCSVG